MDACRNASNLANPGPSQGANAEKVRANGGIDDRINQIVIVVTQMAAMLMQANGMPIPHVVQKLGAEIPHLEASHQNEHPAGNGRGEAPTINHHDGNTHNTNYVPEAELLSTPLHHQVERQREH